MPKRTAYVAKPFHEVRAEFQKTVFDDMGTATCPCCERFAKVNKRKINSTMARGLIWLVREYEENGHDWVHVPSGPRDVVKTNQLSTLKNWDLIRKKPHTPGKVKSSGFWKPTKHGLKFARNKTRVPEFVLLYNDGVLRISASTVGIVDALGEHFDYQDVMHGER